MCSKISAYYVRACVSTLLSWLIASNTIQLLFGACDRRTIFLHFSENSSGSILLLRQHGTGRFSETIFHVDIWLGVAHEEYRSPEIMSVGICNYAFIIMIESVPVLLICCLWQLANALFFWRTRCSFGDACN